jgi:hypothetical protein
MYIQGGPVEIQTSTQWNLIGGSTTTPQYSAMISISLRFHFHKEEFGARYKNAITTI